MYCILAVLVCSFKFIDGFVDLTRLNARLKENSAGQDVQRMTSGTVPTYFDWRYHNGVSPVKDQGQCGACWAFSAVANIESQYWIRGHQLSLSEQFLIDCNTMGAGCSNAGVVNAFADIVANLGGVMLDKFYPYEQHAEQCRWDRSISLAPVVGLQRVQPHNEDLMVKLLLSYGPLSAGINDAMMTAKNRDPLSIDQPTEEQCHTSKDNLNHAVLIVGYNVHIDANGKEVPYWVIKNSWGEDWGDHGYYYLERGTNACGIAVDVSFAIVP